MKTAAEQQQILNAIWPKWRAVAASTHITNPEAVEHAVRQLYSFCNRPEPSITWMENVFHLPRVWFGLPFYPHVRERLIYSVWNHLHEPDRLCARIGYDPINSEFRLHTNKSIVFSQSRLSPARGIRPPWLINCGNIISQFDTDALALHALAKPLAIRLDPTIGKLAAIVTTLVSECFAAILFTESCILVRKPVTIVLNETQQLSAQDAPAFQTRGPNGMSLYIINGRVLSTNHAPRVTFHNMSVVSPAQRERWIAYIGWESFLKLALDAGRLQEVHRDKYGQLYRIACGTQLFTVVRVKNSSPEPDGSFRQYVIPVDPQCRPLPDPLNPRQVLGPAQPLTALNAVASTFYMIGPDYAKVIGDQS